MPSCPSCGHQSSPGQRFCGHCGANLDASSSETKLTTPAAGLSPDSGRASDGGRFLPGTILAGRYRMIGLLGRGGMGEVYRADDLKLGQPVALKFLPRDVEAQPDRLERFLTEVRLSLRVTHPNVCRVYDIGQAEGRHFLSMEYVDGEDLASLLRRIGRLPEDKAVEIARQLCAGLEAAHAEGVLHRDLKPANVMLDSRGRARLTDFGLAGATEGITGYEARAGTPQYMAPEQLAGGELSKQTDLYSLGLVLYELFTGRRAFEAAKVADLARLQQSTPTSPSAHVSGLDPAIERAILRCLAHDPANRPSSAAALAAALPGGDPLAMAQAAGETPSPEMVARAGGTGALRPPVAVACLSAVLVGLVVVWVGSNYSSLFRYLPLTLSPDQLRGVARSSITAMGYATPPVDVAYGFGYSVPVLNQIAKDDRSLDRWSRMRTAVPPAAYFWYRESPAPLVPVGGVGRTGSFNPPMSHAGMVFVRLDPEGHMALFMGMPPEYSEGSGPWKDPDWTAVFGLAGLSPADFEPAASRWTPPNVPADAQRAWVKGTLRVEAASYHGRPVWFEVIPAWRTADTNAGAPTARELATLSALFAMGVGLLLSAALLARRNARLGRGNPQGAFRLVAVFALAGALDDLLSTSTSVNAFLEVFFGNLAWQLFLALVVWLAYMAIEPYVRRLWPHALIAWQRMLEGRFRDPLVGRHLLIGAMAGIVISLIRLVPYAAPWLGLPPPVPRAVGLDALGGFEHLLAGYFSVLQTSLFVPVGLLLGFLVLRAIFRRPWIAAILIMTIVPGAMVLLGAPAVVVFSAAATLGLAVFILTRWGLFAMLIAVVFSSWNAFPLTIDPSSWYFPWSVATVLIFAAVGVYGFIVSLAGQALFKVPLLDLDRA